MSDTEMEKEKWKIQAKLFKDEKKDVMPVFNVF